MTAGKDRVLKDSEKKMLSNSRESTEVSAETLSHCPQHTNSLETLDRAARQTKIFTQPRNITIIITPHTKILCLMPSL